VSYVRCFDRVLLVDSLRDLQACLAEYIYRNLNIPFDPPAYTAPRNLAHDGSQNRVSYGFPCASVMSLVPLTWC
jgi:hypothetical protein